MNIIVSLCYFMNKKLGQSKSSFEVQKNINLSKYPTVSVLTNLDKKYSSEFLFLKEKIIGFHKILHKVIIQII